MPVSYDRELIFIHIPKCGGSSIEHALNIDYNTGMRSRSGIRCKDLQIPNMCKLSWVEKIYAENTSPQHLPATVLKTLIPDVFEKYTKFAVVRNPFDRLVSEYHYTMKQHNLTFDKFFNKMFSMSEFDRYVFSDAHYTPQWKFIYEGNNLLVDEVFYFEKIDEVFKWLNLPAYHLNATNKTKHYMDYYNSKQKELIRYIYKEDFDRFGYTL